MGCEYQRTYSEIAQLSVAHPSWPPSELRRLAPRERKFWIAYHRWVNNMMTEAEADG